MKADTTTPPALAPQATIAGNTRSNTAGYKTIRPELLLLAIIIWAMTMTTFSLPGRTTGGIDALALLKFAIRTGTILLFVFLWLRNPDTAGKQKILWFYSPFIGYLIWASFTTLWSPLKSVSISQLIGLTSLLMLSAWVALLCRQPAQIVYIMKHLWLALLAYTAFILLVHLIRPDISGLTRHTKWDGLNGIIHPTYAGATSGLGLLLTLLCPKALPGFKLRKLLYPALAAFGALLLISNSRTALALTVVTAGGALLKFYPPRLLAALLLSLAAGICLYMVVDPSFTLHKQNLESSTDFITRGQSSKQLSGLSGRAEMWEAIWEQIEIAPLVGHGYFVTSTDGMLDVWAGPSNHTAHNISLQVLVSTGIIGGVLFFFAMWRIGFSIWRLHWGDSTSRSIFTLSWVVGFWYFGWCQTCISYIGPLLPESVLFFLLIGLGAGQFARLQTTLQTTPQTTPTSSLEEANASA